VTRVKTQDFHSDKVEIIDDNHVYYPDIDRTIYYDAAHLANMNIYRRGVHHDRDHVACVVGDPGSGKSVFAHQMAKFFDPGFDETQIYFRGEDLIRKLVDPQTPKYTAYVYDEAREGLSARNSMSRINKIITDCLAEIRQKNLFIIVVLPDFWDLDSNVANKRSRCLYHVYEVPNPDAGENEDPFQRGYVRYFNRRDKNFLYIKGRKFHDIQAHTPSLHPFTFLNQYVVDENRYRAAKAAALRTNRNLEDSGESKASWRRSVLPKLIKEFPGRSNVFWGGVFDVDDSTISRDIKVIYEGQEPPAPGGLPLVEL
jgi:ABC-type dipeptide/oligopeptide/nickel transport system ATPase subunit